MWFCSLYGKFAKNHVPYELTMKIIAIGRNNVAHIHEQQNEVPSAPVVFTKPDTALIRDNEPFYYPSFSNSIHHELEVVLKISKMGKNIEEKFADPYSGGNTSNQVS